MMQSHGTSIVPSPARLGLTGPHSPSFSSNPNPKPLTSTITTPPTTTTTATTTTTTTITTSSSSFPYNRLSTNSSALLPLLPPLSRAQALLLQMSSLAVKLFEVSPNRHLWLSSFRGSFPAFLSSPPPGVAAPDLPNISSTKEAIALFTSLQTQLFEAVAELQESLDLQDSKVRIAGEIRKKDATLLAFAKKIKEAEQVLDLLVDDYADYRRYKRPRQEVSPEEEEEVKGSSSIDIKDILSYSHRISYTTFAPPEFGAGQAPLRGALPPAPQDEQMRASQLYRVSEMDVSLPKSSDAKDNMVDRVLDVLIEPTPPRDELPPPLPWVNAPGGWQKGIPPNLPIELPPAPPGWKPGDPIPLTLLDGFLPPNKGENQQTVGAPVMPNLPPMQPRQPKPIEVRHVQLDINPEDEYGSDYSSEVGSSDEDDED